MKETQKASHYVAGQRFISAAREKHCGARAVHTNVQGLVRYCYHPYQYTTLALPSSAIITTDALQSASVIWRESFENSTEPLFSYLNLYREMIDSCYPFSLANQTYFSLHINSRVALRQNIEFQLFGESLIIDGVFITMLMIMSKLSSHSTFWTKLYCPQAPISFSSTHSNILKPKLLIS